MNQDDQEDMFGRTHDKVPVFANPTQKIFWKNQQSFNSKILTRTSISTTISTDFKFPVRQNAAKSRTLLESIGSSARNPISRQRMEFPADVDEAYNWLVNVNDELLERFDSSIDEFKRALGGGILNTDIYPLALQWLSTP